MNLRTSVDDVLQDMLVMAHTEAKKGGKDAIELYARAEALTMRALGLEGQAKLRALESIANAVGSGLAAIANERARAAIENAFTAGLKFAGNLLRGLLGLG